MIFINIIQIIPGVHVTLSFWISEKNCNPNELQQEVRRELDRVGLGRQLGGLARGNGGMLKVKMLVVLVLLVFNHNVLYIS
jgi:hypothetical protein